MENFFGKRGKKSRSRSGSLPAESVCIFDACAVIALLDAEPGAEVVETLLAEESCRCVIHLLNICEVYYHVYRRADQQRADKLRDVLESYGFEIEDSLLPALWREASRLKAEWRRVSLRQLRLKFGPLVPEIEERVRSAEASLLLEWSERVLTAERLQDVFRD